MKVLRFFVLLTFMIVGLVFAREKKDSVRLISDYQVKNNHFWVKDHGIEVDDQLNRKRSHKRRRKIRRPIKGLR